MIQHIIHAKTLMIVSLNTQILISVHHTNLLNNKDFLFKSNDNRLKLTLYTHLINHTVNHVIIRNIINYVIRILRNL